MAVSISGYTKYRLRFLANNDVLHRISRKLSWYIEMPSGNCTGGIEKAIRKMNLPNTKAESQQPARFYVMFCV
jgi:hypothetical protein